MGGGGKTTMWDSRISTTMDMNSFILFGLARGGR